VDAETEALLDLAEDLHHLTEGILDPTMLPLIKVWDWKIIHEKLPARSEINEALALTGFTKIQRQPGKIRLPKDGMGLDFGGFGKEYAVDQLADIAGQFGIQDLLIDLGRDLFGKGGNGQHPFWHVGIEDGRNPGQCWGGLAVSNYAVAASGDYARRFEYDGVCYGHILDPRTGWPVANGMRAVTVVAPTCLQAGIYSTTLFVLGTKEGRASPPPPVISMPACNQTTASKQPATSPAAKSSLLDSSSRSPPRNQPNDKNQVP
jgi:thiamine biosynthesis lipoprotein